MSIFASPTYQALSDLLLVAVAIASALRAGHHARRAERAEQAAAEWFLRRMAADPAGVLTVRYKPVQVVVPEVTVRPAADGEGGGA